ncbi:MAG: hypothetical protein JW863_01185 [Chitinispirillaceae bacterium]|nr:hypothetical protein [Chitinispirillaceae bacterium]
MAAIIEVIHTALEITGIAFGPVKGDVVLEFALRNVCHFSNADIHGAFVNKVPLYPQADGDRKNVALADATDFLSWNLNPKMRRITAVKKGTADFVDFNGKVTGNMSHSSPFEIDKIYPDDDLTALLCVHSKSANIDFYETGAGVYRKEDNSYSISDKIHSSELAVSAGWNSDFDGWIIYDAYQKKLFFWKRTENEATDLTIPQVPEECEINYYVNDAATAVTLTVENDSGFIAQFWTGDIGNGKITWQAPESVLNGLTGTMIANPIGTKIAVLRTAGPLATLCVIDRVSGKIVEQASIDEKYTGVGIGWLSDSQVICAGIEDLFLLDLNQKKVSASGKGMKIK